MITIPLTVLAVEGVQVRIYLARLKYAGYRPERIILTVFDRHPKTKKPVGKWLPASIRMKYAQKNQTYSYMYWPRLIRSSAPHVFKSILKTMPPFCSGYKNIIETVLGEFRYEDYTHSLDRVLISSISDPRLQKFILSKQVSGAILYTGGGILRDNLLSINGLRFIHIHPGFLPHVRGADGMLWSISTREKVGMSAFYMNNKIDKGEIIAAKEFDFPQCILPRNSRPNDTLLYNSIFSYIDPALRAEFLVNTIIAQYDSYLSLPTKKQDQSVGTTYRFMDEQTRNRALKLLFKDEQ